MRTEIKAGDARLDEFNTPWQQATQRQSQRLGINLVDGSLVKLELQKVIVVLVNHNHAQSAQVMPQSASGGQSAVTRPCDHDSGLAHLTPHQHNKTRPVKSSQFNYFRNFCITNVNYITDL